MQQYPFQSSFLDDPREEQRDACGVGFIAHLKGEKSHAVVSDGLEILRRMDHRGGRDADNATSDGAGLLIQIPHALIQRSALRRGKNLPEPGKYAVGMLFLPQEKTEQEFWHDTMKAIAEQHELSLLFLRDVPTNCSVLGSAARQTLPHIQQAVFAARSEKFSEKHFAWQLFILRKKLEEIARTRYDIKQRKFYIASLSQENICYKALVLSHQLGNFYLDLKDSLCTSAYAMTHLRFSTNTMPAWPLAQPFRVLCHNGEINTLRANINAMFARSFLLRDERLQNDIDAMGPLCTPGMSDSAMLDNAVEFLLHSGRSLPHVLSMFVPEPWEKSGEISSELKEFYEYHSYLMEPWDGPALIAFCHQNYVGAVLDRNGLRPGRYWVTNDGFVIMASEAGVLSRSPENIVTQGRLSSGQIFLVDTKKGKIIPDSEIKSEMARSKPYGQWLRQERLKIEDLTLSAARSSNPNKDFLSQNIFAETELEKNAAGAKVGLSNRLLAFGYSKEDLKTLIAPMANDGKEPDGSMGTDTPLAILSKQRPLLYNYFKQLFAQVTNPPIDALREDYVTSLSTHLGAEHNLFSETPQHCSLLRLQHPVLTDEDLHLIRNSDQTESRVATIDTTFELSKESVELCLERINQEALNFIKSGKDILILSDRNVSSSRAALPALLSTSSVHHALIRCGARARCSLVVESGEPREVHHFALLVGYGAAAINPYLIFHLLSEQEIQFGLKHDLSKSELCKNYIKSVCDGLLKIMSKMGISTLHSYRGGQIFEAIGISSKLVDQHFTWTPSRIEGIDLLDIEDDVRTRHTEAFACNVSGDFLSFPTRGEYQWQVDGEQHLHSPEMIATLQKSTRIGSREEFKKFCETLDNPNHPLNLRGLLTFQYLQPPVDLAEVEPVEAIVKRFSTGAMSFGSLSKEAHETIAVAMNRMGARSNSGEGGEDPERYLPLPHGESRRSAIKQVASARFGVTSWYLTNADELQIKIAQGAKPGEGGQLPGHKVDDVIAKVRHSTPGITLISPPPHHDIYSIEDLAQLIYDLKSANRRARVSVKLVSESGIGTIAAGVAKAKAEAILISGYEGGTGASPLSSIKHAGLPWELGLSETHRTLVENDLRSRVVLQTDGQLRTPRDIAIATLLGAEEWGIATGALITLGCIMMRKCHLNTCPVGIATQDPLLRQKFSGQPESLINYIFLLAEGLREIMAQLGFRTVDEMVGRVDLLTKDPRWTENRLRKIELRSLFEKPQISKSLEIENRVQSNIESTPVVESSHRKQNHQLEASLDMTQLLPAVSEAIVNNRKVRLHFPIKNTDRSVGTIVSSEVTRHFGPRGLPDNHFQFHFQGTAGQSFMAFAVSGVTAKLEGEANDYLGKGLSGGQIILVPHANSPRAKERHVICGNTALYGATSGRALIRGIAGERFAVRNSGAHAIVEGVGNHGCEYMTGGTVIVLGSVGRNFAAGMSGGYAFLYDPKQEAQAQVNRQFVEIISSLDLQEEAFLKRKLEEYLQATQSPICAFILANWSTEKSHFIGVVPPAYRNIFLDSLNAQDKSKMTDVLMETIPIPLPRPLSASHAHIQGEPHG